MPVQHSSSSDPLQNPVPGYLNYGRTSSDRAVEVIESPATPQQERPTIQEVHWAPIGLWLVAMVLTLFVFEASEIKALFRHLVGQFRIPKKAPCTNCRYFSDNVYLKCTVHPTEVLTERAVDCKDFCTRSPGKMADINPPKR